MAAAAGVLVETGRGPIEFSETGAGAPVLTLHGAMGGCDQMVPFDPHATTLAAQIAGAKLLTLDGGEHVAIFTHRAEVRARVGQFLNAHG